ncbi:AraC family transcriptional regulator [Ramlibacter sp. PS4R-6]|uniref:AraC family transcriptional regulator n=1 Tax=Ramlibacter sp. PS4R-6 TaxID=3133438 RepID=UPI0030A5B75E
MDYPAAVIAQSSAASHFETTEPGRAVRQFTGVYGPHSLAVPNAQLQLRMRSFELAQLHIAQIRYGAPVTTSMSQPHPYWVFSYVCAGESSVHQRASAGDGQTYTAGTAGVNNPENVADLVMSPDLELVNIRVSAADMRAACGALLGAEHAQSLRFDDRAEVGSEPVRILMRVVRNLADATRHAHPAARRYESTLRDAALYELLMGWPNSALRASQAQEALPESTRRARDYIHAHASEAPTVAEIAAAAGVGVRALALGFEKHFGMAPLRYLQQVRLDGVRAELTLAREGDTVTRIALDWGFANLGVFSARYRERFGEPPAETLRRHLRR